MIRANAAPLQGVLETLAFLQARKIKIGLATSSYEILIQTVLKELKISSFFEVTHSAEHEAYGKPHPAVYLTVADRLAVSPVRCLVIEDSLNGIISGKAAKMKVVCIPEKTHFPEPKLILADYHFDTMTDFLTSISD